MSLGEMQINCGEPGEGEDALLRIVTGGEGGESSGDLKVEMEVDGEENKKIRNLDQIDDKEYRQKLKETDPERYQEEMRRRKRYNRLVKLANMTEEEQTEYETKRYMYSQAKIGQNRYKDLSDEEKARKREWYRNWTRSLKGEKREQYLQSVARAQKKLLDRYKIEEPEKWQRHYERTKAYQRRRYANESEEERNRRRWKEKVNAQRRKLKKKLEEEGVDMEEIERRSEELKRQMWEEFGFPVELHPKLKGRRRREDVEEEKDGVGGETEVTVSSSSQGTSSWHLKPYRFVCIKCNPNYPQKLVQFRTRSELFYHVKKNHKQDFWPCKNCNMLKYSKEALRRHLSLCFLFMESMKNISSKRKSE